LQPDRQDDAGYKGNCIPDQGNMVPISTQYKGVNPENLN
jgi:hypothetical protein